MTSLSDPVQFEMAYKQYFASLVGFAYQYVEDSEISEDIVQEMFGKLWDKSETVDIRTNLKSYLFGAVRNACLNHLRHQKVVASHESERGEERVHQLNFMEMDELQEKVNEALAQLPEKRRQIFELSRFQDKKYHEIAAELDVSIKTVETQMSRALKVMREVLGSYILYLIAGTVLFLITGCRGKMLRTCQYFTTR